MVSRAEVTELCNLAIKNSLKAATAFEGEQHDNEVRRTNTGTNGRVSGEVIERDEARGDSEFLGQLYASGDSPGTPRDIGRDGKDDRRQAWESQPTAATLRRACKIVLDHLDTSLSEEEFNAGYCASTLLATGIH